MKCSLWTAALLAAFSPLVAAQGLQVQPPRRRIAPPRPVQVESRFDGIFYKAYYLENEEKKVDEAIQLYREYLEKAGPGTRLGRKAFGRLSALLAKKGDNGALRRLQARFGKVRARRAQGGMGPGRMVPASPPRNPLSREEWIKQRTQVIQRMEERLKQMKESGRGAQFAGRMEKMLARMKKELESVKKGGPLPPRRRRGMMMGRQGRGRVQVQGRIQGRRRGLFRAQFAKMPPDQRDKAFTALIERLVGFQERMKERGRDDFANRMKALIDKLEGLAAKGKWQEVDKALREGFRRRR